MPAKKSHTHKLAVCALLAILLISALNNPVYAYDALDKLARGVINLLVSPLEFLQGIGDAYSEHDIAVAFPAGLFWGTVNTVKRAAVGAFEIATFPLPIPAGYVPIIEEPAFLGRKKAMEEEKSGQKKETSPQQPETEESPEPEI